MKYCGLCVAGKINGCAVTIKVIVYRVLVWVWGFISARSMIERAVSPNFEKGESYSQSNQQKISALILLLFFIRKNFLMVSKVD